MGDSPEPRDPSPISRVDRQHAGSIRVDQWRHFHDETIRQRKDDGTPFAKALADLGIIPGIKVDAGAKRMPGFPGEKITEGLDGLRARLFEYAQMGARFAKWRAVLAIGDGVPTLGCIEANAHALARYAALCQEAGLARISHACRFCARFAGAVSFFSVLCEVVGRSG